MEKEPGIFDCHPLFEEVQLQQVFPDGKTFVDCMAKQPLDIILRQYNDQKNEPGFSLKEFVHANFELPAVFAGDYKTGSAVSVTEHIKQLWPVLTRQPDEKKGSLIPLPHSYIVPGGRFGEVYYWDSYFTMLGLKASGMYDMIGNMVANFSHLIQTVGFIPNGNRTYYLGRSQPPFYALMIQLLVSIKGKAILPAYLSPLEKEYNYWMKGMAGLDAGKESAYHVVKMKDGEILNRYFDEFDTARPESFREDVELSHQAKEDAAILYKHLRAGAESGWDYSSRWFKDGKSFATIHTADIIPVDLNCLLYYLEHTIAEAAETAGDEEKYRQYAVLADKRKEAIQKYCWNENAGFYFDYDFVTASQKNELTLAGSVPLYFRIATESQADLVAEKLQAVFLKQGGLVTTLKQTGQQWDAPNGWAPLQWLAVTGLENYHHHSLANSIAQSWIKLNTDVFNRTGKLMEKYNVVDTALEAGGGEYPGQDGFGWTNGVLLALIEKYGTEVNQ
ncbi:MAG: alpha,alpha-trehalase TreF [Ferruginibacter sp.]